MTDVYPPPTTGIPPLSAHERSIAKSTFQEIIHDCKAHKDATSSFKKALLVKLFCEKATTSSGRDCALVYCLSSIAANPGHKPSDPLHQVISNLAEFSNKT